MALLKDVLQLVSQLSTAEELRNTPHSPQDYQPPLNPSADDCPIYYNPQTLAKCSIGPSCHFRHCPDALNGRSTCKFWKNPNDRCNDTRCKFRHAPEADLICSYDGRCTTKSCPYKHIAPRPIEKNSSTSLDVVKDLQDLLTFYGLQNYWEDFDADKVEMDVFLDMTEEHVEQNFKHIPFGDRRRIMMAQQKYNEFLNDNSAGNKKRRPRPEQKKGPPARQQSGPASVPHQKPHPAGAPRQHQPKPVPSQVSNECNIYVKDLAKDVTEVQLKEHFQHFGTITSVKIMRFDTGASKGFGFVNYQNKGQAEKAIASMNGKTINAKQIYVAFAQRKEDRQAVLAVQHHGHQPGGAEAAPIPNTNQKNRAKPPMRRPKSPSQLDHPEKNPKGKGKPKPAKKTGECTVCMETDANVVLIPCGHICICENCSENIKMKSKLCPICRTVFTSVVKTFDAVGGT